MLSGLADNQDFSGYRGAIVIATICNVFLNADTLSGDNRSLSFDDIKAIRISHADLMDS